MLRALFDPEYVQYLYHGAASKLAWVWVPVPVITSVLPQSVWQSELSLRQCNTTISFSNPAREDALCLSWG